MPVRVSLVGAGNVGRHIVHQLLAPALSSLFVLESVANSAYQVSLPPDSSPPSPQQLLDALPSSSAPSSDALAASSPSLPVSSFNLSDFSQHLVEQASLRTGRVPLLFIDSTSDNAVAAIYPALLRAGVSVVTPNKKAFSAPSSLFDDILAYSYPANPSGGFVYKESTVGAGLPIISTLDDLVRTGDRVTQIAGVFSGTLSYIFNNFSPALPPSQPVSFSSVVKEAKSLGYTEPHPGDDLDGSDVARKLCILARSLGLRVSEDNNNVGPANLPHGFASVPTESLIPERLNGITSGDEFVSRLSEFDHQFDKRRRECPDKVLRYVGFIDVPSNTIQCKLMEYPKDHPFAASLSGSDNIISFKSERYNSTPLIIQGPGAGASVTAMGVVADAIRVAEKFI